MKSRFLAVIVLLLAASPVAAAPFTPGGAEALIRSIGPCGDTCVVNASNGGRIVDFEDAGDEIRSARKRLVIDGYCASACMVLADRARPRACITERAVFAYHKTSRHRDLPLRRDLHRWIVRYGGGFPENAGTPRAMPIQVAKRFWPLCRTEAKLPKRRPGHLVDVRLMHGPNG